MKSNFIYEVTVVFAPKTEEKAIETVFSKLESMWITATVDKKEHLGVKDLAYQIKSYSKGDFWTLKISADKTLKLNEINLFLNREPAVIRYLVIKK